MAKKNHYTTVISHRSGEREDATIADIAVGATAAQTKPGHFRAAIGSPSINQLLRIEEELGDKAVYGARIR